MKSKEKFNPFLRLLIFIFFLGLVGICIAIGLFYYIFSIPEPEGLSLASWPKTFTNNFSYWIQYENGAITVTDTGMERLDKYGLWVQIIDETGQEVFSYNKPVNYPISYTASELIEINTSRYENGSTVFASKLERSEEIFNYMIGFPYAVGKYMLYYNGEKIVRLSPVVSIITSFILGVFILFILGYGFWLSRQLSTITKGIRNISLRAYEPIKESGTFSKIYSALNTMYAEIRNSDRIKEDTDRTRREWITNITHDLKTPLSPAKGYAELITDMSEYEIQNVREYGSIILKNINHAEKLMNDLKLTYQLEAGAIPYHPQKIRLIRYLKELVIDIVNDPVFAKRDIEFECNLSEIVVLIDPDLFRRALQNLIVNALVHNTLDTKVKVIVISKEEHDICIMIHDNGIGMSEAEQSELFNRYYRGTNTKEHSDGSGLGLAIAKQIVLLHNGKITVKSEWNKGTEFTILLPL